MSKELEALKFIKNVEVEIGNDLTNATKVFEINHEYDEAFEIIEKSLKALEIIKETPEFAWYIFVYENAYEMIADRKGFRVNESAKELQEKFDLLKEVLK